MRRCVKLPPREGCYSVTSSQNLCISVKPVPYVAQPLWPRKVLLQHLSKDEIL